MSRASILGTLGLSGFNDPGTVLVSQGSTAQPTFSAAPVLGGVSNLNFEGSGPLTRIAANANTGVVTLSAVPSLTDLQAADWTTGNNITNWSTLQLYLSAVAYSNRNISPSAVYFESFGSVPYTGGVDNFIGAVVAPNGTIYFVPHDATLGRKLDPVSNRVGTYSLGPPGFVSGNNKNLGGVLAPNGRIYLIPAAASPAAGYINPANDVCTTFGNFSLPAGANKWYSGALAPNGLIYCSPHNASQMLIINPNNDTMTTLNNYPGTGTWPGSQSFTGAVLAPNGRIYLMGLNQRIANVNPNDNTVTTYASNGAYAGGAVAPNGKVYFAPYTATSFLVLDPSNDTMTHFGTSTGSQQYEGIVLAQNGKLYCISLQATILSIVDPQNNTVTTMSGGGYLGSYAWTGAVLHPNGKIYFAPWVATSFLALNVPSNNNFNINVCTNPFFNKY